MKSKYTYTIVKQHIIAVTLEKAGERGRMRYILTLYSHPYVAPIEMNPIKGGWKRILRTDIPIYGDDKVTQRRQRIAVAIRKSDVDARIKEYADELVKSLLAD